MTINLTEINPGECYRILENERFGHLACCKDGQLYVAAIYFAFSNGVAYSFTMPGKKLDWMRGTTRSAYTSSSVRAPAGGRASSSKACSRNFLTARRDKANGSTRGLLQKYSDWWEIGSIKPQEFPMPDGSPHVFYGIAVTAVSGRSAVRTE
ncbi:hypothetical protein GGE46_005878 [Rhizobium etli]|uniref:Pyridoxamine 5'-phosphate oxidase family protein n=1 Tax=Rhizobium etli TaxID=29449 RepID=A0A7W7EHN7_RHIET|nr:pyridoxamine 5'-phosphate oxidase-like protein [Rhizobium sp. Kim5]MBB4483257.1 hypothetical protein [Rhizobium etli]MBB4539086.1 hypothetical protein [Rhizobium etli]PDT07465.1 hypothetical protein CO655_27135 [Rhizobium sp. M1]